MNKSFSLFIIGGLAVLTIGDLAGAQTACDKRILNRPGCEVGDFGPLEAAPQWGIQVQFPPIPSPMQVPIRAQTLNWLQAKPFGSVTPDSNQAVEYHRTVPLFLSALRKQLFLSAIQKQAKNDLTGAIDDYLAALKLEDNDPAIHWYLGTAYWAAGKTAEANREFDVERKMKGFALFIHIYPGGYGSTGF